MPLQVSSKKNSKSVLFIASFAGCPRVWKMASALAKNNYSVTVLEWDRDSKLSPVESVDGICIHRMRLKAPYGAKLFFMLPVWWVYTSLILLLSSFDFVQPQNLDNLLPLWMFARMKGLKIVYDIADFYGASYVTQNVAFLRRAVSQLERILVKVVDIVILADESRKEQISIKELPFFVIYNSPPDVFSESPPSAYPLKCSSSKLILFYAGVFEADRGLDVLINAVQNLPGVELIIAGFGRLETELENLARVSGNIQFLHRIRYGEVLKLTLSCDCVVALYDPKIPNNQYASPNKLFEAMMCGKAIITNADTKMAERITLENCGLLVAYGNIRELRNMLIWIRKNPESVAALGKNGRAAYLRKYDWTLMEKRLLQLYASLDGR